MERTTSDFTANFRLATEADYELETYDNTKLVGINTCPTYGILRYQMHRVMPGMGRSLALEAGSVMHECFAFIRLVTLVDNWMQHDKDQANEVWSYQGARLFGRDRFEAIVLQLQATDDISEMARRGAIAVLDTSGYHDDPRDKRRTLSNLEECIFAYINRWRWDVPVWVRDQSDPHTDVGIEIPFDLVVSICVKQSTAWTFRLTGKIDGIHVSPQRHLVLHENKTASRLNDAWSMSFALSSQITTYCVAATVFTQQEVNNADVFGLAIPLPKSYEFGGFVREPVSRRDYHYERWVKWLVHTISLARQYKDDPYNSPRYTHSC